MCGGQVIYTCQVTGIGAPKASVEYSGSFSWSLIWELELGAYRGAGGAIYQFLILRSWSGRTKARLTISR
jgi:hypothetical protein